MADDETRALQTGEALAALPEVWRRQDELTTLTRQLYEMQKQIEVTYLQRHGHRRLIDVDLGARGISKRRTSQRKRSRNRICARHRRRLRGKGRRTTRRTSKRSAKTLRRYRVTVHELMANTDQLDALRVEEKRLLRTVKATHGAMTRAGHARLTYEGRAGRSAALAQKAAKALRRKLSADAKTERT